MKENVKSMLFKFMLITKQQLTLAVSQAELLNLSGVVVLGANSEVDLAFVILSHFQDAISPVVGTWTDKFD
jgi:hypothetical protein